MCYWEEQSWLRSKSIHAAEFLHGTLEIVDETTPVTLFIGEDGDDRWQNSSKIIAENLCQLYNY